MIIDFNVTSAGQCYHIMTQTIIPRPIAWVLSQNEDGSYNLAPFSYFNGVSSEPPILMLSIGKKENQEDKDTRLNILSGRPFVIHIPSVDMAALVTKTAAELEYGRSEVIHSNIPLTDFPGYDIPRLKDCKIAYGCRFYDLHELGPGKQGVIYAEIKQLFVADDCISRQDDRYVIDAESINPLARLGGAVYSSLGSLFSVARPK